MAEKGKKNIGASVRARLLNISKEKGRDFNMVLTQHAIERLLHRLSLSAHANGFVLKGAILLMTWLDTPHRGTRDLDLLGFGAPSSDAMLAVFREVLSIPLDDGVAFDADQLRVTRIREELPYGGLRLVTSATISGARLKVSVDVGFGDSLEPGDEMVELPVLLDMPAPRLRAYARETVIAEKFQAMVALGLANTRLKDFHDIWVLSRTFAFEGDRLPRAIAATFERRGTAIPSDPPDALTPAFAANTQKQEQWRAFVEDVAIDPGNLDRVVADLAAFLMPHAKTARRIARRNE